VSTNLGFGILLVLFGGVMEGIYAVPTRYTPRWKWEHIWGGGSLMSILLVAWPMAWLTIPEPLQVLREAGTSSLLMTSLFGAAWGLGGIFFGLGVEIVGIAVGVSLILGMIAVVGSALPLLIYRPDQVGTPGGEMLLAALAVMIVGIVLCGYAGNLRQRSAEKVAVAATAGGSESVVVATGEPKHSSFMLGMLFCILSGVLSPMVNFAAIKGDTLRALAIQHGAKSLWAMNAVWLLVFTVAYGVFVLYSLFLMMRNKTFSEWLRPPTGRYWVLAGAMGLLWGGGVIIYGTGVTYMGALGAYAGWPLLLVAAIAGSNVSAILIGEWKGADKKSSQVMAAALVVLVLAAVMLGFANRMLAA
jgi:L-rhamnose-H+ transport protein